MTDKIPQTGKHLYFDVDTYYNSEPYESVSDMDGMRNEGMDDALSCGEIHDIEQWITVESRNQKRVNTKKGKAKALLSDFPVRQTLTKSKSRLMQRYSNVVRLPETAFFDL